MVAERLAWSLASTHKIDMVTVHPAVVRLLVSVLAQHQSWL